MFKLGTGRLPFDDAALASAATMSRFEHATSSKDIYRLCKALVEQFIAGFASPPSSLILDLDHSEDAAHGQQPLAFYNHHYRSTCYLPLMIFDGQSGALVAAVLRPGKSPTGVENAMIMRRVLTLIRRCFPDTHILVRGDGHFGRPELMQMIAAMPNIDFIFGLPGNVKLQALAEETKQRACELWASQQTQDVVPEAVRLYDEFPYAAGSWQKSWRVLLKAEVMALGENPRFVGTSLGGLDAGMLYEDVYCARGQSENFIKHLKNDLASDRTSCTSFLANFMRLLLHAQRLRGKKSAAHTRRTTVHRRAEEHRQHILTSLRPVSREIDLPPPTHNHPAMFDTAHRAWVGRTSSGSCWRRGSRSSRPNFLVQEGFMQTSSYERYGTWYRPRAHRRSGSHRTRFRRWFRPTAVPACSCPLLA